MASVHSPRLLCSRFISYTLWIDIVDLCIRLRGRFVLKDCRIGFGCLLVVYSFNKHIQRVYRLSSPRANRRQQQHGLGSNQLTRNPRATVSTSRTFSQCEWVSNSKWESERVTEMCLTQCRKVNWWTDEPELISISPTLSSLAALPLSVCLSVCLSAYQSQLCCW